MQPRERHNWNSTEIKLNEQTTTLSAQIHGLSCPKCRKRKFTKNGKEKGNQRYICTKCGKHFRSTTGNTIHHLHLKPKINAYIDCMNKGLSLRKTAETIGISLQTAFRWRHRFLSAIQSQPAPLEHKNRIISTYTLPFSNKGKTNQKPIRPNVSSLLQIDITGQTTINIIGKYNQTTNNLPRTHSGKTEYITSKTMPGIYKQNAVKCTDTSITNNVKQIHKQINLWLGTFRGVATKYLDNYWKWFTLIRHIHQNKCAQKSYLFECL